jgi:hypothetical protein
MWHCCNNDIFEPALMKERTENEEPKCVKFNVESELHDPRCINPCIETAEPSLANERQLCELPILVKDKIDSADPNLP